MRGVEPLEVSQHVEVGRQRGPLAAAAQPDGRAVVVRLEQLGLGDVDTDVGAAQAPRHRQALPEVVHVELLQQLDGVNVGGRAQRRRRVDAVDAQHRRRQQRRQLPHHAERHRDGRVVVGVDLYGQRQLER